MKKIYQIPVLGYLFRLVRAWIKAPVFFDEFQKRQDLMENHLRTIEKVEKPFALQIVNSICSREDIILFLNNELSGHPKIWGNPAKLHIASSASVYPCLFNTNSGEITIGEHTFSGSGVSILAGGHDFHLTGFLRRDAELTEGCDIVIGNGVWLGSECTLLGPCQIGDNAVIAAGAVVTPGTTVPSNTIYGGIPAQQIGKIEFSERSTEVDEAVLKALERNNGILMISGWSEKTKCPDIVQSGHYLLDHQAMILSDRKEWQMFYALIGEMQCQISFSCKDRSNDYQLEPGTNNIDIMLPINGDHPEMVSIQIQPPNITLFIIWKLRE